MSKSSFAAARATRPFATALLALSLAGCSWLGLGDAAK